MSSSRRPPIAAVGLGVLLGGIAGGQRRMRRKPLAPRDVDRAVGITGYDVQVGVGLNELQAVKLERAGMTVVQDENLVRVPTHSAAVARARVAAVLGMRSSQLDVIACERSPQRR